MPDSGKSQTGLWIVGTLCVLAVLVFGVFLRPGPEEQRPTAEQSPNEPLSERERLLEAAELDPDKQKYIWDTEHATFLIETHFGKPLVEELKAGQWGHFLNWFQFGFEARVDDLKQPRMRTKDLLTEKSAAGELELRTTDASGLGRWLRGAVEDFEKVERARLRVLKIKDLGQSRRRFETHVLLTAVGPRKGGGHIEHESNHTVTFEASDFDNLKAELIKGPVISEWVVRDHLLRESASPLLFEEVTEATGLDRFHVLDNWKVARKDVYQYRFQTAAADFDGDGYVDLLVVNDDGRALILKNEAGTRFRNVAHEMGITEAVSDISVHLNFLAGWVDYNNDGFPDILAGDKFFHNDQGRRFIDITDRTGLTYPWEPMGVAVADYDSDGLPDLYILNQHPKPGTTSNGVKAWVGESRSGGRNRLWRNEGGGRFRDVTEEANAGGGKRHSFAAVWLHHDEDAFPDLYIANDFGENVLLRNRGDGTFEDITPASGTGDYATSMGVNAGDLDNDGSPEIYIANMYSKMGRRIIAHVGPEDYPEGIYEQILGSCAGNRLYRQPEPGKRYEEISDKLHVNGVGWAYAPALVDLDNDGWLDLYATTGFMSFDPHKPDG